MQVDLLALVSVEKYMGWVRDKRCGTRVREHWARTQAQKEVDAGRQGGRGLQVVRVSQPVVNLIRGPCDLIVWTAKKKRRLMSRRNCVHTRMLLDRTAPCGQQKSSVFPGEKRESPTRSRDTQPHTNGCPLRIFDNIVEALKAELIWGLERSGKKAKPRRNAQRSGPTRPDAVSYLQHVFSIRPFVV